MCPTTASCCNSQTAVSIAAEVLKKVENNLAQHTEYLASYEKAKAWIDTARGTLLECSDTVSSSSPARKERLQASLAKVQVKLSSKCRVPTNLALN